MNHREHHPDFQFPQGRGYTPVEEPAPLWALAILGTCWVVAISAGTAYLLPLASHFVRWVLRHG
jgi:hypothetical protein